MIRPNFPNFARTRRPAFLVGSAALIFASSGCIVERTVTEHDEVVYQGPVDKLTNRDLLTGANESPEKLAEEDDE